MTPFIAHVNNMELDQISFFLYCLNQYADIPIVVATDNYVNELMREKFPFINTADMYNIRNAFVMTFPNSCNDTFINYFHNNKAIYVNTIPSQYAAFKEKGYLFNNTMLNKFDYVIKPTDEGIYGEIEATHIIDEFDYDAWSAFYKSLNRNKK